MNNPQEQLVLSGIETDHTIFESSDDKYTNPEQWDTVGKFGNVVAKLKKEPTKDGIWYSPKYYILGSKFEPTRFYQRFQPGFVKGSKPFKVLGSLNYKQSKEAALQLAKHVNDAMQKA